MMRRVFACVGLFGAIAGLMSCSDTDDSRWAEATNPASVELVSDPSMSVELGEQRATASLPAGLRAAAIQATQAEAPAHYDFDEGACDASRCINAPNAAQGFGVEVAGSGARVASDHATNGEAGWHVGLGLGEVCRGTICVSPDRASTSVHPANNRAVLDHEGGVEEWYVNGPLGLEQGFTIAQPPRDFGGARSEPLVLRVEVAGPLTPRLRPDGASVALQASGGRSVLRYSDLVAFDATGQALKAWMTVEGQAIVLHVNDVGAQYPIEIDPLVWSEVRKLEASSPADSDDFGFSVAISGDLAVVGAPMVQGAAADEGAAYVFERDLGGPDSWGLREVLVAVLGQEGDWFGYSVAISGDAVVVGAPFEGTSPGTTEDRGAAYLFERNFGGADAWGQSKMFLAGNPQVDARFGTSVAISGDVVLVGAGLVDGAITVNQGAAYLFERDMGGANNWGLRKQLVASDPQVDAAFGTAVALSGDVALVGALWQDGVGVDQGAAYLFERNFGGADNWGQHKKLVASDGAAQDSFGCAVGISGDSAVVGASFEDGAVSNQGAAYVFDRNHPTADNWGERKKLTATAPTSDDRFGSAVAISGDLIVVGAYLDDDSGAEAGAAYLFGRNEPTADNWGQQDKLIPADAVAYDSCGWSVSVGAADILLGVPFKDSFVGSDVGAAYLFGLRLTDGEPCDEATDCVSGYCIDGVCCATECAGGEDDCDACSIAAGAEADGTCGPRTDGSACEDGTYCNGTETCTSGACGDSSGDPCAASVGDADPDCSESCDEDTDTCTAEDPDLSACDDGVYCNGDETCMAGACSSSTGDPCSGPDNDEDCAESCDETGQSCTADDPDGAACADGTRTCRSGECLGAPGSDCTDSAECESAFCTDDVCCAVADCTPYRCGPAGDCGSTCTMSAECATGYHCDGTGRCIADGAPSGGSNEEEGGCSCRLGSHQGGKGGVLLGLGLCAVLGIRRRLPRRGP